MYTSERDTDGYCALCGKVSDMEYTCDNYRDLKGTMDLQLCFDCINVIKDGAEEVFNNWGYVKKPN